MNRPGAVADDTDGMNRNEFEGNKVRLRAVEPEDWEELSTSGLDTDLVRRAGVTHVPRSQAAYRSRAEDASKAPEGDQVELTIETLDGSIVGWLGVNHADRRNRIFSFGVTIGRDHWRKRYATEALELLFCFYFSELGYQKVDTWVLAFNEASLRFHEAFGFVVEGRRRRAVFTKGEYHDFVLVGMTREEFVERHA